MNEHPGLTRHQTTGMFWFRRRIPTDLQRHFRKTEHKVTLGTKVRAEAELLAAKEFRETTEQWDTVRYRLANNRTLTERDAEAVAGEMYRRFLAKHRTSPGKAADYVLPGNLYWFVYLGGVDSPLQMVVRNKVGLEIWDVMKRYGVPHDYRSIPFVYIRVAHALAWAHAYMFCYLKGDVVQDRHETMFPPILVKIHRFEDTFATYVSEKSLAKNTIKRWEPAIRSLLLHVGHDDLGLIHRNDVATWLHDLKASGRNPITVRNVYLGSVRSLFGWLLDGQMIDRDPTVDHRVHGKGPARTRAKKGLYKDEAKTILRATLREPRAGIDRYERAARRWIPWLCAYTGARVNELTQLRRQDVFKAEGVYAIHITPTAGTVKNRQARDVPLHSHLLEQGFLDFVRGSADGPLFHELQPEFPPRPERARGSRPGCAVPTQLNERLSARLATWVRSLGVADPEVAPNHGWRHRFNTMARKVRMDREKRDALKGHAPASVAESYGEFDLDDLRDEIEKLPRYDLDTDDLVEDEDDDMFLRNAPTRIRKAAA